MIYYLVKIVVSALLIVLISEIAKRSSLLGAILASVPLISVIAMFWLYFESKDTARIISLSNNIFWLVIPSLSLFLVLPVLLKRDLNFYFSMGIAITVTVLCYFIMLVILERFGIRF